MMRLSTTTVRRLIRHTAISVGALLVLFLAAVVIWLLTWSHFPDRQNQKVVLSISKKLAPLLVTAPQPLWDTDLQQQGFPQDDFDSPYLNWSAPNTVALSDSMAAVTFRRSRYEGKQFVMDGNVVALSLATGSVVTAAKWPGDWKGKKMLAPNWQKQIGVGPYVYCCTPEGQFYAYSDGYLIIKNGKAIGRGEVSPAAVQVVLKDKKDYPEAVFQTGCGGGVHSSSLSSATVVITTDCGTMYVVGADGHALFSDSFPGAEVKFGGASRNGKRFVLALSAWHSGDPRYMTDEWLVVYDVEHRGPVLALKSNPLPYLQSQSALSDDGTLMLIGSGGHLKLLNVPN
jgi:hypothetical protein